MTDALPEIPLELRRVAHHEAGHAVCAWALGHSVAGLSIGSADDGKAHIAHPDDAHPYERAAVAYAGGMGGDLSGEPQTSDLETLKDECDAGACISEAHPEFHDQDDDTLHDQVRDRLRSATATVIAPHHDRVRELAAALAEKGELSAGEVAALLGQHPHNGAAPVRAIIAGLNRR